MGLTMKYIEFPLAEWVQGDF